MQVFRICTPAALSMGSYPGSAEGSPDPAKGQAGGAKYAKVALATCADGIVAKE